MTRDASRQQLEPGATVAGDSTWHTPALQTARMPAGGIGTHVGQIVPAAQSAALSAGSLETLAATQSSVDPHSQHARPLRSRQSPSTAQLEYSGTLRMSKASQRLATQRAAMLGLLLAGHSGQTMGTGQVATLKASRYMLLTPAKVSSSGTPHGSQHPLRPRTH
jgi:hypothetical protein